MCIHMYMCIYIYIHLEDELMHKTQAHMMCMYMLLYAYLNVQLKDNYIPLAEIRTYIWIKDAF